MKMTKVQKEIYDLISNGWELGVTMGLNPRAWIQKGGIGRGGESKQVRINTVNAMRINKIIKIKKESYPTTVYELNNEH